jgi:GMP synthase (glutamine-hydrolysing)
VTRIMIFDGAPAASQAGLAPFGGRPNGALFTETLARREPSLETFVLNVADDERLPQGLSIADFDGVVITGSPLNIYNAEPAVSRQLELAREIYEQGTPVFGSCWGLQLMSAALGGTVRRNPLGREVGIARTITLNRDGRHHPMFAGKDNAFSAICSHEDELAVETAPEGATVLAANRVSAVQAIEIERDASSFWGVQYHPEFDLATIAAIMERRAHVMIEEGLVSGEAELALLLADFRTLAADPTRRDLAWRHGLDDQVLDPLVRGAELGNWLDVKVRPRAAQRSAAT